MHDAAAQHPGSRALSLLVVIACLASFGCRTDPRRFGKNTRDTGQMLQRAYAAAPTNAAFVAEKRLRDELLAESSKNGDGMPAWRHIRLARSQLRVGDTDAAIAACEDVLADPELEGELRTDAERLLATAWLRLAEQENCVAHHNERSCIYPIAEAAHHHHAPRGAIEAIDAWTRVLERSPDDLHARWMLNLSYMAIGQHPGQVPPEWLIEPPVDPQAVNLPPLEDVAPQTTGGLGVSEISGGCAVEDFNGDSLPDIVASTIFPIDDPRGRVRLFLNRGNDRFDDATEDWGLTNVRGGLNLLQADYDNDGDVDVLVLRGGWKHEAGQWPNTLLRNDGDRFTDVTVEAGLLAFQPTQAGGWADYDRDGFIDLFVGNESGLPAVEESPISQWFADFFLGIDYRLSYLEPGHLYHNNGDGTFTDVLDSSGIDLYGWIKGAHWGDHNGDGLEDLYVAIWGRRNRLFENQGDGSFRDVAEQVGVADHLLSFATWFFDYDNDGDEDLLVCGYPYPDITFRRGDIPMEFEWSPTRELHDFLSDLPAPDRREHLDARPILYENEGFGVFTDVTLAARLDDTMSIMGANFDDLDNDGRLDLMFGTGAPSMGYLVPNRLFLNRPGRFVDASIPLQFSHLQKGHGIGLGDFDRDGDRDLYMVLGGAFDGDAFPNALLRNPGFGARSLSLRLIGGEGSNRLAIGARLRLDLRGKDGQQRSLYRVVNTGGSFGASSLERTFGLGSDDVTISRLTIEWPDSKRSLQTVTADATGAPLAPGAHYIVRQGEAAVRAPR